MRFVRLSQNSAATCNWLLVNYF